MGWSILNRYLIIIFSIQNSLNVCRCILIIPWKQIWLFLLMGWSLQRSKFVQRSPRGNPVRTAMQKIVLRPSRVDSIGFKCSWLHSSLRLYPFALFFCWIGKIWVSTSNATSWNWLFDSRAQQHCFPFFFCNSLDEDSSLTHLQFHVFGHEQKKAEFNLAVSCDVQAVVTFSPIGSMHCIFTHIWLIFMVPVGKYTIHGSYGSDNHITVVGH